MVGAGHLKDFLALQKGGVGEFNSIGRLQRDGRRSLLRQGNTPYCGPNSTCMALDTLGKRVNVEDLVSQLTIDPKKGVNMDDLLPLFKQNGISAKYSSNLTMDSLRESVANGNPAVVRVMQDVYGSKPQGVPSA